MITKSIATTTKRSGLLGSLLWSLLRSVRWVIEALISVIIALFMGLIFLLINQKQNEYDKWKGQSRESR